MNALILGASGGLAIALAESLIAHHWQVDLVTRESKRKTLDHLSSARVFTVPGRYSDFDAGQPYDAYFFTQALFSPTPLTAMTDAAIASEIEVGLLDPIRLTRKLLMAHPPAERRNFCYIGSTSAYAGFRNTSVYCAVKHGLLGFVRAMNDEYAQSDARFWLFSMGTMNTDMGAKLTAHDPASFLQPHDVAERIVDSIGSPSNLFEPEVIMRRRAIRLREA